MKKLFLVELIFILLTFCCCSTTDNTTVIHDFMLQAEDSYLSGNLEEAAGICQQGFNKTSEPKLLYNQAVYTALTGEYYNAFKLCLDGYKQFPDKKEFAQASLEYLKLGEYRDLLYTTALSYWRNGLTDEFVVSALYSVNPDEWGVLYTELTR